VEVFIMDQEPVKLGRINRAVEKALKEDFGEEVWIYLLAEDLDKMASKWPSVYLSRISEASKIIKSPDYAAYLPKENTLYFIKEYLRDGHFQKVALAVKKEGQWHLKELYALKEEESKRLAQEGFLARVSA
jgi:hypothetical protein